MTRLENDSELRCTTDYALFTHLKGNRPIDQKNVDKIAENMKKVGFKKAYRIVVDSEGRVKIGQHRLIAAEQAQVPVWYIVDTELTVQEIQGSESLQKKWTLTDYISSYAELGNEEYIKLKKTYDDTDLMGVVISYFWGRSYDMSMATYYEHVKNGTFLFTQSRKGRFDLLMRRVLDIFAYNSKLKYRANAFEGTLILVCHPDYDHSRMLHKLEFLQSRLVVCPTRDEYVRILFDIYNYKVRDENLIKPLGKFKGR